MRPSALIRNVCRDIESMLRQHKKTELARNVRRPLRNGNRIPLSAWMAGTASGSVSKIEEVIACRSRYPYATLSTSIYKVADRLTRGKSLTALQRMLALEYVAERYRGSIPPHNIDYWCISRAIDKQVPTQVFSWVLQLLIDKIPAHKTPLSFILDDKFTNAILALELYTTLDPKHGR